MIQTACAGNLIVYPFTLDVLLGLPPSEVRTGFPWGVDCKAVCYHSALIRLHSNSREATVVSTAKESDETEQTLKNFHN